MRRRMTDKDQEKEEKEEENKNKRNNQFGDNYQMFVLILIII